MTLSCRPRGGHLVAEHPGDGGGVRSEGVHQVPACVCDTTLPLRRDQRGRG